VKAPGGRLALATVPLMPPVTAAPSGMRSSLTRAGTEDAGVATASFAAVAAAAVVVREGVLDDVVFDNDTAPLLETGALSEKGAGSVPGVRVSRRAEGLPGRRRVFVELKPVLPAPDAGALPKLCGWSDGLPKLGSSPARVASGRRTGRGLRSSLGVSSASSKAGRKPPAGRVKGCADTDSAASARTSAPAPTRTSRPEATRRGTSNILTAAQSAVYG
jgi:hypothetical protein